jgi:prepilin-type N-terminal cleavage/methylation domain-containing protein
MVLRKIKKGTANRGFTLIELLVVIAIIAILAAILFPVFAQVRESVRKSTCMTQMHDVYVAVQQYKVDNNKYPTTLYDYAELPGGTFYVGTGTPVPMNAAQARLLFKATGGRYMKDPALFTCPDDASVSQTDVTPAVYPVAPGVTLSGQVPNALISPPNPPMPAYFYKADDYDVGPRVDAQGNVVKVAGVPVMDVHYSLSWTNITGAGDAPNQLKYPDPPADKTVLTWCTYHVATAHSNVIPVMMLSGTAKPVPTDQFVNQGPVNFKF